MLMLLYLYYCTRLYCTAAGSRLDWNWSDSNIPPQQVQALPHVPFNPLGITAQ